MTNQDGARDPIQLQWHFRRKTIASMSILTIAKSNLMHSLNELRANAPKFRELESRLECRAYDYITNSFHQITLDMFRAKIKSTEFGYNMGSTYGWNVLNEWIEEFYKQHERFVN